jgi:phage antirepressor YoqD-like protein
MPTQKSMESGLFEVKERTIDNPEGKILVTRTTKVTGHGFLLKSVQEFDVKNSLNGFGSIAR